MCLATSLRTLNRMLADLHLAAGDISAGLTTVEEGLDLVARCSAHGPC
jgi:hypothetical protein